MLASKSILASFVTSTTATDQSLKAFDNGVKDGQSNLLHASFLVRTNQLFNKYSKEENYYYFSNGVGEEGRAIEDFHLSVQYFN